MRFASRDKRPLREIAIVDQETIDEIAALVPSGNWGNIGGDIQDQDDLQDVLGDKEDKIPHHSLVADEDIDKIHEHSNKTILDEITELPSSGLTQAQILTRQL